MLTSVTTKDDSEVRKSIDNYAPSLAYTFPMGVFRCDVSGKIIFINQQACDILQLEFCDAVEFGWQQAIHVDERPLLEQIWQKLVKDKSAVDIMLRLASKDNVSIIYAQLFPEVNTEGQLFGVLGSITDKSRINAFNHQQQNHSQELANQEHLSGMGEVATGLAHELNQPLTVISVYAHQCLQRLEDLGVADKQIVTGMTRIKKQALRAGEILHSIKELFQTQTIRKSKTTFNNIVQQALDVLNGPYLANITLEYNLQQPPIPIFVDELQMEQVVINLVKNACEAMHQQDKSSAFITFEGNYDDKSVNLLIGDTGVGITSDKKSKIFEPFFTCKNSGMGLGLSICRSIIEAHEGTLTLESSSENGSVFKISIPNKVPKLEDT